MWEEILSEIEKLKEDVAFLEIEKDFLVKENEDLRKGIISLYAQLNLLFQNVGMNEWLEDKVKQGEYPPEVLMMMVSNVRVN